MIRTKIVHSAVGQYVNNNNHKDYSEDDDVIDDNECFQDDDDVIDDNNNFSCKYLKIAKIQDKYNFLYTAEFTTHCGPQQQYRSGHSIVYKYQ